MSRGNGEFSSEGQRFLIELEAIFYLKCRLWPDYDL